MGIRIIFLLASVIYCFAQYCDNVVVETITADEGGNIMLTCGFEITDKECNSSIYWTYPNKIFTHHEKIYENRILLSFTEILNFNADEDTGSYSCSLISCNNTSYEKRFILKYDNSDINNRREIRYSWSLFTVLILIIVLILLLVILIITNIRIILRKRQLGSYQI
ncbi:uncharacterized protein LOC129612932 [Condylostylus longicornis]|uniref:uncharacterized protein LOC129612932 n=1 Tax=Condylostylus longicornis TaxID=2530218 RepID=UPI00244DA3BB|nr:uncharacterized protein LOC129612932 [Condylostylus longicornis]XP_055382759.1 uncharacterized protein LOC129612932 [Condylostylus longicornis]